ncbi:hypothetical protein DPMN_175935 [Dreissena polymorpha]|uniref:C2H2-type domain-containing protein n=1 Tax=Dreissena polymorpha TaxID=45954 RepID=A0A9D4E863_DREPO|nr:hypothetical protein DPMN_175935 [Dreissena polymorpha]
MEDPDDEQDEGDMEGDNTELGFPSQRRIHTCNFCEKSFKKNSHLKEHIRSHTGQLVAHLSSYLGYLGSMFVL